MSFSKKEIIETFLGDKLAGLHGTNVVARQIHLSLFMGRSFLHWKARQSPQTKQKMHYLFSSLRRQLKGWVCPTHHAALKTQTPTIPSPYSPGDKGKLGLPYRKHRPFASCLGCAREPLLHLLVLLQKEQFSP